MYMDVFFGKVRSLRGNTCASIYVNDAGWSRAYPLQRKADAHESLDKLFRDPGVPHTIVPDNAAKLTKGEFKKKVGCAGALIIPIEAYTPKLNLAESGIRELKRMYKRLMRKTRAPECLWDYCIELCARIRSATALDLPMLDGETGETHLTGDTKDISNLAEFSWYEWVWYQPPAKSADDEFDDRHLGKWLGPSHDVGEAMCSHVLTERATVLSRTSVFPLTAEDRNSEVIAKCKEEYMEKLKEKLGEQMALMGEQAFLPACQKHRIEFESTDCSSPSRFSCHSTVVARNEYVTPRASGSRVSNVALAR